MTQYRVLIGKVGLDGHDRGAKVIARALRDAGFEVIYSGLHQTPQMLVRAAIQEDVDCIGVSILSGAHNTLLPEIVSGLAEADAEDIFVFAGGVIPDADLPTLEQAGVVGVFTPGTATGEVVEFIREECERREVSVIFELTEDQRMIRQMVRRFVDTEVLDNARRWDEIASLPLHIYESLNEIGLMAATMPPEEQGSGLDPVSFVLALEELGRGDASLAIVVASHDAAMSLLPEEREAMVENGEIASVVVQGLMTESGRSDRIVTSEGAYDLDEFEPDEAYGPVVSHEAVDTLGLRAARLAKVEVPGDPPLVWYTWSAAVAVGLARAALQEATSYAQEREQFGKPISAFQAIQFKLAEMATAVDAARLMALHAAAGEVEPSQALRFAADAAVFVTDEAVQIHGGYGYVREYPVERYYRDARWFALWAGR